MNNAEFGITIQKFICEKFDVPMSELAKEHFKSNSNPALLSKYDIDDVISLAFKELKLKPVNCLTYTPSDNAMELYNPNNFILSNNKTLSIRTSRKGGKVAPRVVGQAGIDTFNYYFNQFMDKPVTDKEQIKSIIYNHIHEMLPIFFDYLFVSDFTIWLQYNSYDGLFYTIFNRDSILDLEFERSNFSFTRDLDQWKESTTLKYKGISIAEIQIHKNRTFKFRFIMNSVAKFLKDDMLTNETIGITAEKAICDIFNLSYPDHLISRSSILVEKELISPIKNAFLNLPKPIEHTGSLTGNRGGNSKCSYDFLLENNKTLSLKTNTGKMVCPPEVGQPSSTTCYFYFKDLCDADEINSITFKEMVFKNIDKMLNIYSKYLFDSDYLLWLYKRNNIFKYEVFNKDFATSFVWDKNKISFTNNTIETWNESNTVKYDGLSIGEFQVHKNRNSYKFRFNLDNLVLLFNKE